MWSPTPLVFLWIHKPGFEADPSAIGPSEGGRVREAEWRDEQERLLMSLIANVGAGENKSRHSPHDFNSLKPL